MLSPRKEPSSPEKSFRLDVWGDNFLSETMQTRVGGPPSPFEKRHFNFGSPLEDCMFVPGKGAIFRSVLKGLY